MEGKATSTLGFYSREELSPLDVVLLVLRTTIYYTRNVLPGTVLKGSSF